METKSDNFLDSDGLNIYHKITKFERVRGMSFEEFEQLSDEEKKGLIVIPDGYSSDSNEGNENDSNFSGPIQWEDINGRPDLSNLSKLDRVKIVISTQSWDENNEATVYSNKVPSADVPGVITPIPTPDSENTYYECDIMCVGHSSENVIFKAGSIPEEDVEVYLYIQSVAEIIEEYTGEFVWWSPEMTSANTPEPFVVSASSTFSGRPAYYLFDGNLDLFWSNAADDNKPEIIFCFGKKTIVAGFSMHPLTGGNRPYAYNYPQQFIVYGSNDGQKWEAFYEKSGINDYPDEFIEYEFDKAKNYMYYKIGNMKPVQGGVVSIAEIKFLVMEGSV